jgi:hypothetical protein
MIIFCDFVETTRSSAKALSEPKVGYGALKRTGWKEGFGHYATPEWEFHKFIWNHKDNELSVYRTPDTTGFRIIRPNKPALYFELLRKGSGKSPDALIPLISVRPQSKDNENKRVGPSANQVAKVHRIFESTLRITQVLFEKLQQENPEHLRLPTYGQVLAIMKELDAYRKPKRA